MAIFRVQSGKNYTGQKIFTQTPSVVSVTNMSYDVDNDQRRKVLKVETRLRIQMVDAYKSQNIMTLFRISPKLQARTEFLVSTFCRQLLVLVEAWLTTGKAIARPRLQTSTWHTYLPLPLSHLSLLKDSKIEISSATFLSGKDKKNSRPPLGTHLPTSPLLNHLSL